MGTVEKMFTAFGTVNHLTVRYEEPEREQARQALEQAERLMNDLDDRLSVFKENSELSQINRRAGIGDTQVSPDTFALLRLSKQYGRQTGGAFDITTQPLTRQGTEAPPRVDYRDILLDPIRRTVRLRHRGQGLHVGGIAKGYAADRIDALLRAHGVRSGVINLGGTVRCIGESRSTGIRNPFAPEEILAELPGADEAVVTSGLYERGCHIFDPVTGRPAETDLAAVTVVGRNGAAADAAATACMVLGMEKSSALLRRMRLEGILIDRDGRVFTTPRLPSRLRLYQQEELS